MSLEIDLAQQHKCGICLEYSTETSSVNDQVSDGISYLDINLKFTKQLKLDGSNIELQHICVKCTNMVKTEYNFKEPCEAQDYKLEFNEEIIIEEKVKIEDENVINFTSNQCKSEDEFISNNCCSNVKENNHSKLLNKIKVEPIEENTNVLLGSININSSEKTENVMLNCSVIPLKEGINIVCKTEKSLEIKDENATIEEALEIYCDKQCDKTCNNCHSRVVHKHTYIPESLNDYTKHIEAEHADKSTKNCNHCNKTLFDTQACHCDAKKYACAMCGSKFAFKKHLTKHLRGHEPKKRLKCSVSSQICKASTIKRGQVAWTAFPCKICDKKFKRASNLRHHHTVVHNLRKTSCHFCDFLPKSRSGLKNHMAQKHAGKKSWNCGLSSKFKMVEHMRRHMTTQQCDNSSKDKSDSLKENRGKSVVQETLDTYVCKMCNKRFKHRSSLRKHITGAHNIIESSCYYCEYISASASDLSKHTKQEHADKKNVACDQCDRTFFEVHELKVHLLLHYGIKNYECEICKCKCTTKSTLKRHMRKHTDDRPFQCSVCGKSFKQHCNLKNHLANQSCKVPVKKVHEAKSNNERAVIDPSAKFASRIYACKVCDKTFIQRSNLRRHNKTIHKITTIACLFCDYVPDSTSDLTKHSEKEHADKKIINCERCDKTFFEFGDLKRHLIVHNTVKNHVCKICGYKFTMELHLTEHMTIHTGEKPFKCSYCDKSFRLLPGLTRHMSTHSDLTK